MGADPLMGSYFGGITGKCGNLRQIRGHRTLRVCPAHPPFPSHHEVSSSVTYTSHKDVLSN